MYLLDDTTSVLDRGGKRIKNDFEKSEGQMGFSKLWEVTTQKAMTNLKWDWRVRVWRKCWRSSFSSIGHFERRREGTMMIGILNYRKSPKWLGRRDFSQVWESRVMFNIVLFVVHGWRTDIWCLIRMSQKWEWVSRLGRYMNKEWVRKREKERERGRERERAGGKKRECFGRTHIAGEDGWMKPPRFPKEYT